MSKGKFNYPDLDVLDSPLISPSPLSSLSNIPGSAIAERIFNDPESWEDTDTEEGDFPVDIDSNEQLAWLTEEIEKFRAGMDSGRFEESPSTPKDKDKITVNLVETPTSGTAFTNKRVSLIRGDQNADWKGIGRKPNVRPISLAALFESSNEDFSAEIQQQLSKILESGGIPHHIRPIPHSSALSPPSTSGSSSTLDTPLHPSSALSIGRSEGESPINVYSASATLSFLEWYGIYPDSPKLDLNRMRPKSARLQAPLIQVPSPRHAVMPFPLPNSTKPSQNATIRRTSPVPPPGLEPPTDAAIILTQQQPQGLVSHSDLSRSPPPMKDDNQPAPTVATKSTSDPERVPKANPPEYVRTSSPTPAPPRKNSNTNSNQSSRAGTPSRGMSGGQEQPVRRLPTIPPENNTGASSRPTTPAQPLPPVPSQNQSQASVVAILTQTPSRPPTRSQPPSHAQSRTASPAPATRASCPAPSTSNGMRPSSSIRSPPLSGPAGPRIRSRISHNPNMRSSSAPTASSTIGNSVHRPPVLRL